MRVEAQNDAHVEVVRSPEEQKQELVEFVTQAAVDCAVAVANDRPGDMSEWGVNFYMGMLTRIAAIDQFFDGGIDLINLKNIAISRAREIDEGRDETHPPVWKTNEKGEQQHVRISNILDSSWVGLTAELSMLDVLWNMELGRDLTIFHGGDLSMLVDFDRLGKADFLLMRIGERNEVIGIQVKRHGGRSVTMFNISDEGAYQELIKEAEELKANGQMNKNISMENGQRSFAHMVSKYFGRDFTPVLLYVLVGNSAMDKKTGLFVDSVRGAAGDALKELIDGKRVSATIYK